MKVSNMTSNKGNKVPNQFIITDDESGAQYFQSYDTVIAKRCNGVVTLDEKAHDWSGTTVKYRNLFLCANSGQVLDRINNGEYLLADLNKGNRDAKR